MIRMRGFTLIELMVVVVIMAILFAAGVPLTAKWIHGAHVHDSLNLLMQGKDQMRAVALRNPQGADIGTVAAGMKLESGSLLSVCHGDPSNAECSAGGSQLVWATDLSRHREVQTTIGGSADAVLRLDATGVWITAPSARTYEVSKGSQSQQGQFP